MKPVNIKLSWKILTILTIALALPMVTLTFLSAANQANDMIDELTRFGNELTYMVFGCIRYPMARGDSAAVRNQLLDLRDNMEGVEIMITDPEQKVVYATSAQRLGSQVDETVYDQRYRRMLQDRTYTGNDQMISFEDRISPHRYLTTVRLIANQSECHRCHGEEKRYLGAMVVRFNTDETYAEIKRNTNYSILIGVLGIAAVIGFTYMLLYRLLTLPISRLSGEMKKLPDRLARGEYPAIPSAGRNDEIGDLEKAFNQMVDDLEEKQAIINRTNKDLVAANKELEAFAYSVSHDLRAPLRNIDGFSKILLDEYAGTLDETGIHYLNRVRKGVNKMSTLIDDILTFSRAGRVELRLKSVPANRLVNSALRDFAGAVRDNNVEIKVEELPELLCDPVMMENVLANLISNAIKYARGADPPRIMIGYDRDKGAIVVRDNGIGFDLRYHEKIFQVFQRLQLPEEYEGTGIGLAVVKRIVERHHGMIWAESEPGKGAAFFIRLPGEDGEAVE